MENLPIIFPFLFVGIWILATYIISKMGWAELVDNYQTNVTFEGKRIGIISDSINNSNYNNSIIMKYNENGISFSSSIQLFMRPLFLVL